MLLQRIYAYIDDNLSSPDLSPGTIALRWGFTDTAHFSRVFKAAYGASPSVFRMVAAKSHRLSVASVANAFTQTQPQIIVGQDTFTVWALR